MNTLLFYLKGRYFKCSPFLTMRSLFLILILIHPLTLLSQQSVTLNQAIEMGKVNHPRLKIADAEIESVRSSRNEAWEVEPTSFTYAWGQINGEIRKDKQMQFVQGIGSVVTPFYKNALVSKRIITGRYYRKLVEKEIVAEIKRAWCYYLHALQQADLYSYQSDLADKLGKDCDKWLREGKISQLERNMSHSLAADLNNKLFQAKEELKLASSRLQWACYSDQPVIPADSGVILLPLTTTNAVSEAHLGYFRGQTEEKKAELRIEQSRFFPEFSVGYVRQDILPHKGLNSWMVGISFPLFFSAQQSRLKQARINFHIQQAQEELNIGELNNKITELGIELTRQNANIRYYTTTALSEADNLINAAILQLRNDDIDVTQFIQSIIGAMSIKENYFEAVYLYNVAVIETELYK